MSRGGGRRVTSPDTLPAIRGLFLLFVSVWVAQVWGPDNAALPVGAALAVVGSVLTQPGSADRRPVAAALTVNLSIVVAIGILAGGHPLLFIGAVVAACLIAGLLWMFGGGAGLTGVAVLVVLLASGAVPATLSATVQTVGMVLGFGVAHLLFAARWTRREELAADFAGDTHFPDVDRSTWRETMREQHRSAAGLDYAFVTYELATQST